MGGVFQGTGAPLSEHGFALAAKLLATADDKAALWALLAVETRGFGYLADRRPKILFERHVFHARTGGRFSAAYPDISNASPGGYAQGPSAEARCATEYSRLGRAMTLDRVAALQSASWGLGQIMGFNAASVGYGGVDAMVEAFKESEDNQLLACAAFITRRPALAEAFRNRAWARVAFFYNGKNYAANRYDEKLKSFYSDFSSGSLPIIDVRAAQARLIYLGFDPKGINGREGPDMTSAIKAFQKAQTLSQSGSLADVANLLRECACV